MERKKSLSKLSLILLMEYILAFLLFLLSYCLAGMFALQACFPFVRPEPYLFLGAASLLSVMLLAHYKFFRILMQSYGDLINQILPACFLSNAAFIVSLYFMNTGTRSILYFTIAFLLQTILLSTLKTVSNRLKQSLLQNERNVFVGEDCRAGDLVRGFRKQGKGHICVVSPQDSSLKQHMDQADCIYLTGGLTKEAKRTVLSCCPLEEKRVYILPELYEIAVRDSVLTYIGDTPFYAVEGFRLTEVQKAAKRLLDIILSLLGIVLTLPITLLLILCIKCEDQGPILYTQERSGLHGKPFQMIKFRSMVVDAEKETGAVLATEDDQRITKVGRLIRASRIDEIPQFLNVLAGSMSLVGPRPERPVFVEEYSKSIPGYHYRMAVKPGLTGLAQVRGKYSSSVENKLKYDLMYIVNYSVFQDIRILIETVGVVLRREQAKGLDTYECYNDRSVF